MPLARSFISRSKTEHCLHRTSTKTEHHLRHRHQARLLTRIRELCIFAEPSSNPEAPSLLGNRPPTVSRQRPPAPGASADRCLQHLTSCAALASPLRPKPCNQLQGSSTSETTPTSHSAKPTEPRQVPLFPVAS
ncbi:hypothetical protein TorRG33x02_054110 [Trema orientale]|uniref:Uncharacterized protein n=1 Tax=Trema orientale TaxID=63057 RepID=A0A2P5FLZ5_TREOI|nr:hypothetical protein TorRG33x02_054110 [Trema orientale]